jgi:hypothetical protein
MGPRHFKTPAVASASKIIALVFLYLIGLSLMPLNASAMRTASDSPHRTAAATGLEDPAR